VHSKHDFIITKVSEAVMVF